MAVGAVVAAAGTAYSIWQNNEATDAQAAAERQMQGQLNLQANEMERRDAINRTLTQREGEQFISKQSAAFSANGIDVSSSTGALDYLADQRSNLGRQIELQRQQSAFETGQVRLGVGASQDRAGAGEAAGRARNVGSILSLGGSMANTYGGGNA